MPLLERERELEALERAIGGAARGEGTLVAIEAHAGLGKSRLLAEACERAQARGLRVLRGAGNELEREFAFGVALQLFEPALPPPGAQRDALFDGAAGLVRALLERGSAGDGGEFPLLHGLYWLTANLAERAPLLLAVDDVHWADASTLRFLAYLGARLDGLAVTVIVAFRPDAPAELDAPALHPGPLRAQAVDRFVHVHFPRAEPAFVQACRELTGGNPFLLGELLRGVAERGEEPTAELGARLAELAPETVLRTVLRRVRRLPDGATELARAVAVLGPAATLRTAGELAAQAPSAARAAADALAHAAVLRPGDPLRFVHPLVREVIYDDVPEAARAASHRRAADLLAADGAPVDAIAAHLLLAERAGDGWTVDGLMAAAAAALADGAPRSALTYLRRALEEPPPAPGRGHVLLALGRAEAAGEEPSAAATLAAAVAALQDPRERALATLDLARALHATGAFVEAATALDDVRAALGDSDARLARELDATWVSVARLAVPLRDRAVARLAAIVELPHGDTHAERALLAQASGQLVFAGEPREHALALARRALAGDVLLYEGGADGHDWLIALGTLAWADEIEELERALRLALADARRRGLIRRAANATYGFHQMHHYAGRLREAVGDAEQTLAAREQGWTEHVTAIYAQLAWTLIELDQLDAALQALDRAAQTGLQNAGQVLGIEARARLCLARHAPAEALAHATEAGRLATAFHVHNPSCLPWRSTAALAAHQLGDVDRARELAAEELRLARRFGAPRPIGVALRAAGLVAGELELLREAVATLADSPAALEHTRALVDLGAALRRAGHRAEARTPLREGLALAERMNARALERRAREELIATGARPRRRELTGRDALTPSEQRVVGMAADGLTNRQIAQALFVTVKAVQFHLGNAYRKLGVERREELAGALA